MTRMFRIGSVVILAAAVTVGCGKRSATPVSPSGTDQAAGDLTPGGSLKATAPVPVSPTNGQKPTGSLVLVASKSALRYAQLELPLAYTFEILTPTGQVVYTSPAVMAGASTVSHESSAQLTVDQPYNWRIRAEYAGAVGPWSANAAFVASRPAAFLNETTVWDPLDNGQSIGNIVGPHTWIPGVGLRLDSFYSYVTYELPNGGKIEEGEFSAIASGIPANSEGEKTKVLSMASGYHDLTTNESRFTLERRGNSCEGTFGCIAWRFLTTGGETGTVGNAERVILPWVDDATYFYEFSWRHSIARVRVNEGGANGPEFYNFAKYYPGYYDPDPHVLILGSTPSRSSPDNWTLPGMIIRKVWASWDPRPSYANQ